MIYLDWAATAPPDPAATDAAAACVREAWANPSSPYAAAGAARRVLREARAAVAGLLNAEPQEIIFTSGGSESNAQALALAAGGHAVVSAIEHASVLNAARRWAASVTLVPPEPDGAVRPEAVERALRPDTRLISVMFANNETGVLQPVGEIGALARRRRVPFHCDAVQGFGQVPIDARALGVDLLSLSGHKLGAPRGAGALYARQGAPIKPLIDGGGQEFGLRGGTENVPAICGLGVVAARARPAERAEAVAALMAGFLEEIARRAPRAKLLCPDARRLPGLAALWLPGIGADEAIARLDRMGIAVSGGAACASGKNEISRAYRAAGLTDAQARQVIRISIGPTTGADDLLAAAEAIGRLERTPQRTV